jgi:hypothetical protein
VYGVWCSGEDGQDDGCQLAWRKYGDVVRGVVCGVLERMAKMMAVSVLFRNTGDNLQLHLMSQSHDSHIFVNEISGPIEGTCLDLLSEYWTLKARS